MEYIVAEHLDKSFQVGEYLIIALDDISFQIDKYEFVSIIGASGAGKTTLLNILGTLDMPTSGNLKIDSIDITAMSEDSLAPWRAINLGFIYQSFNLISTLTARENIAFPAVFWNYEEEKVENRVDALLDMVDLSERENHLPIQLSAGEQQRVAIARALVNDPPLIIADEPTANLDDKTAAQIINIFKEISSMNDKTIIVATHDSRMSDMATMHYKMDCGKMVRMTNLE